MLLYKCFYTPRLQKVRSLIEELKTGKYISNNEIKGNDEIAKIFNELKIVCQHINDIMTIHKNDIEKFHELYKNIFFSLESYLLILNENREIIFTNISFCKRLELSYEEIIGKSFEDIFMFITENIKESITLISTIDESVVLEKMYLLSKKRISIIANIKITNIYVQGWNHIIIIIDDITNRCAKDLSINLLSKISTSEEEENININPHSILKCLISDAGAGFSRAMIFLKDEEKNVLKREAVLERNFIKNFISENDNHNIIDLIPDDKSVVDIPDKTDININENHLYTSFELDKDNIFINSLVNCEKIHIRNSSTDHRVDDVVAKFMDVNEFIVVPIISDNKGIGIIVADNREKKCPVDDKQIQLLTIFSDITASLIENFFMISSLKREIDMITKTQEHTVNSEKYITVGRISAHLAHEIRNPLVTMSGYARRVKKLTKRDQEIQKAMDVIIKESERLEGILSNVMDFTKPSRLIMEFNNINDIIIDTVELLENLFEGNDIKLRLELDNDIPLIRSEYNQMKQVILNLLKNAIDASGPGDMIYIITQVVDRHVEIIVGDNGSGVRSEDIDNIFNPFFTTKVKGIGLGLAIVKKIIKDHNGSISLENRDSGGAEFSILLPIS
ncbi:MAG: ATP-binding protein [Spirochaetota bacterium]|nr:ATP-binding protein [Spirochaetota bacterium]